MMANCVAQTIVIKNYFLHVNNFRHPDIMYIYGYAFW